MTNIPCEGLILRCARLAPPDMEHSGASETESQSTFNGMVALAQLSPAESVKVPVGARRAQRKIKPSHGILVML
jgi:hypothetical protein